MTRQSKESRERQEREELAEQFHQELVHDLNQLIEDTIRQAALPNTLAWIGVVVGAFVINIALLILVTGG